MPRYLHAPTRRRPELSQHFARDTVADLIAERLPAHPRLVLEAGAGHGAITHALAGRGFRVVAVEKDPALFLLLASRFAAWPNVDCRPGDFLDAVLPHEPYAFVSNVPFGITAALIDKLLGASRPPEHSLLVVQREAAERFTGRPRQTRIALLHNPWFDFTVEHSFRRDDFIPAPSVDCTLMRIARRPRPLVPRSLRTEYLEFINAAFGTRRQQARDALRGYFTERQIVRLARDLGFGRNARPSEIGFEAWLGLFRFHVQGRLGRAPRRRTHPLPGTTRATGRLTEWLHNAKLVTRREMRLPTS